jgi:two-component system cell cycle response regulator
MIRVLALDDDEEYLEVVAEELERSGCQVTALTSPAEALSLLRPGRFDVILLDLMMPEMDGEEVARQIRVDPRMAQMPILILTCLSDPRRISESLLSGGTFYVNKTAPVDTLVELTRQVVSLVQSERRGCA